MTVATVSAKGWVVIPAPYRRRHHLHPGARVEVIDYANGVGLVPCLPDPVRDARGILRGSRSLTRALLNERRTERRREDS